MSGEELTREPPGPGLKRRLKRYLYELKTLTSRTEEHTDRLAGIDHRVVVSGTRGKSTLSRWLHDELVAREYDTYAKLTGTQPVSMYNGLEWVIPRSGNVTLYENERQIRRFYPMDAIVVENQGITPYTTRLVNTRYVDPNLVVVTNVREDHLDTLGGNRERVARGLARSIPRNSTVICGEAGERIRRYFAAELERRDSTVRFVDVPQAYANVPGAELVFALDEALRTLDGEGLEPERAEAYLEELDVEWQRLPDGRVFDAASVNDVQSTESIRRALVDGPDEVVEPLLYLRQDRPGRTASFARYLNRLAERGDIESAHVVDGHAEPFDAKTTFPVEIHSKDEDPEGVLAEALATGRPVLVMGNANPEFMQELSELIRTEAAAAGGHAGGTAARPDARIETGSQVLVLDREGPASTDRMCVDFLAEHATERVVYLSLGRSPEAHLRAWAEHAGGEDGEDGLDLVPEVIAVGDTVASIAGPTGGAEGDEEAGGAAHAAAARVAADPEATEGAADAAASGREHPRLPESVRTVEDVSAAVDLLESEVRAERPAAGTTAVCVDSVGRLVEERGLQGAFGLLYTVSRILEGADVTAHYHLSTAEFDQETVGTLAQVFDLVVTANDDGEYRLQRNLEWLSASPAADD